MHYAESELDEREIVNLDGLAAGLDRFAVTWIDVQGLGDEAALRRLAEILSLHPLALEDVVNVSQRPKVASYDGHLLLITGMISFESGTGFDIEQVGVFVGKNYVLTFQERYGDVLDSVRGRIRRGEAMIRTLKADYLAYVLLHAPCSSRFTASTRQSVGQRLKPSCCPESGLASLSAVAQYDNSWASGPERSAREVIRVSDAIRPCWWINREEARK